MWGTTTMTESSDSINSVSGADAGADAGAAADNDDDDEDESGSSDSGGAEEEDDDSSSVCLNPSTSVMDDSESISLLRQIFPGESSDTLRQLHQQRLSRRSTAGTSTSSRRQQSQRHQEAERRQRRHQQLLLPISPMRIHNTPPPSVRDSFPEANDNNDNIAANEEEDGESWRNSEMVKDLEHRVIIQTLGTSTSNASSFTLQRQQQQECGGGIIFSRLIFRNSHVGLGLTLYNDSNGLIRVHSLASVDGRQWYASPSSSRRQGNQNNNNTSSSLVQVRGPCLQAGIQAGDVLLGMNGFIIAELIAHTTSSSNLLWQVVETLQQAPSPIVLHFQRPSTLLLNASHSTTATPPPPVVALAWNHEESSSSRALLDDTHSTLDSESGMTTTSLVDNPHQQHYCTYHSTPLHDDDDDDYHESIHPLAQKLAARGIIDASTKEEQIAVTTMWNNFTNRTRKWESMSSLHIVSATQHSSSSSSSYYTTSSNNNLMDSSDVFVPMMGVKKALNVRILNSFLDHNNQMAYTIWIYNVESGHEWYAPVRYYNDFCDLRAATMSLQPSTIGRIPFPKKSSKNVLSSFSFLKSPLMMRNNNNNESSATTSSAEQERKCRQLEHFLRSLCSLIYCGNLHPAIAEVAIHLQSFLGCDDHHHQNHYNMISLPPPRHIDILPPSSTLPSSSLEQQQQSSTTRSNNNHNIETQRRAAARFHLKRIIQLYTYRIFLLPVMSQMVDNFVDSVRIRAPRLRDIEALEAQGRSTLKAKALADLQQIQTFLDHLQNLILDSCMSDFVSIAQRQEYQALHHHDTTTTTSSSAFAPGQPVVVYDWDRLVREAVREQIEIEVYVPLRSVASRWLVNGWRHEDMEVHFKINELRKRPIEFFRIPTSSSSAAAAATGSLVVPDEPSWQSAAAILKKGAGQSTLPCIKLRAIVDAAREISRAFGPSERKKNPNGGVDGGDGESNFQLGADQFLPIFICCVIQAEIERPCALCVLLRTLCDQINKIGEIGYYLASFEAAITHIQEIDLSDDPQRMRSFLHVNLDGD